MFLVVDRLIEKGLITWRVFSPGCVSARLNKLKLHHDYMSSLSLGRV
jgi:hypothetical protein